MTEFKVKCYDAGIWDKNEPQEVEANDPKEAAETVCGGPLLDAGKPGQLRAQVSLTSTPSEKTLFYMPSG
jgi:hypothetical protein